MLVDLVLILIDEANLDLERRGIGGVPLLALLDRVLLLLLAELEIHEFEAHVTREILDRGDVVERLPQPFLQKPSIGVLLNFDEIRHLQNFLALRESHSDVFSGSHRAHFAFFH